jgi:hypothetical protein
VRRILKHVHRCGIITIISIRQKGVTKQIENNNWLTVEVNEKITSKYFTRKTKETHALSTKLSTQCLQRDWHLQGPVIAKRLSMYVHAKLWVTAYLNRIDAQPVSLLRLTVNFRKTVPKIRQLVTHFSPRRSGFNPTAIRVIFVVHKQALQQVYSSTILVRTLAVSIPPNSNNHILPGTGTVGPFETAVPKDSLLPMPRLQEDSYF